MMSENDASKSGAALKRIRAQVSELGSALDAYDRGYADAAERIEAEATSAVRAILDSGELGEALLPRTRALVARGESLTYRWSELLDEIDGALRDLER